MDKQKDIVKKDVIEIPIGKYLGHFKKHFWMFASAILVIALLVVIFTGSGSSTGTEVSSDEAANNLIEFMNAQGANADLISSSRDGSLYKVDVNSNGQTGSIYVTLDGKFAVVQPIPLTGDSVAGSGTQQPPEDVPTSDKPNVELFVMSYCPYGTQMEKGILPVLSLLKDKINFTLRYTHFTLHGEKEDTENFRQLCIREEQGAKFLPYIQCILNSTDVNSPGNVSQCMKTLGIDINKVDSCMTTKAAEYYSVDSGLSQGYGVQGSPTLVINGVQAQSGRSPSAVLSAICSSFNSPPGECETQLPTETPSAGFGFNKGSSSDAAAINCGF